MYARLMQSKYAEGYGRQGHYVSCLKREINLILCMLQMRIWGET